MHAVTRTQPATAALRLSSHEAFTVPLHRRLISALAINPPATRTDRMETLLRSTAQQKWGDAERWKDRVKDVVAGDVRVDLALVGRVAGLAPPEIRAHTLLDEGVEVEALLHRGAPPLRTVTETSGASAKAPASSTPRRTSRSASITGRLHSRARPHR